MGLIVDFTTKIVLKPDALILSVGLYLTEK